MLTTKWPILLVVLVLIMGSSLWARWQRADGESAAVPVWVTFPGDQWQTITPREAGLDAEKFMVWVESQKPQFGKEVVGQTPARGGVVIARGGYLIHVWGDPEFKHQSASLGKAFTRMLLQLAIDEGLIESANDVVHQYWSGDGQLAPHKVLSRDHHHSLSFQHLVKMRGGFPVTNGFYWKQQAGKQTFYPGTPAWANWTGDPDYDNYAHVEPGQHKYYSSGGYWRLSQALTAIWKQDLKRVLDEKIMSRIGIPADRWEWLTGKQVRDNTGFYPEAPGYGDYLDAPYKIDGSIVRGGPGWVIMSASDLARVGLLVATGGRWKGERLISKLDGNHAVGSYNVDGWGRVQADKYFSFGKDGYFSFGQVATGFREPKPGLMAEWIVGPVNKIAP